MATKESMQLPIIEAYGKAGFLKIKSALAMDDKKDNYGKVVFSFVGTTGAKTSVDCYMDVFEFNMFMEDIHSGRMKELVKAGKTYTSNYGGREEDGQPVSRYFTISSSTAADYYFCGMKFPAVKTDKGAFTPVKGKDPLCKISVPISHAVFESRYELWKELFRKYLEQNVTLERYKNNYQQAQVTT